MINQVVLAGRLTSPPQPGSSGAGAWVDLSLEVEHTPWAGSPESCEVCVRLEDEKQIDVAQRYLEADSQVVVHGHLRVDQDQLLVVSRRWQFLPNALESLCMWDSQLSPEPPLVGAGAGAAGISF